MTSFLRFGNSNRPSIFKGPVSPQLREETLHQILRKQCRVNGRREAVISQHENRALTFLELDHRSNALAHGLAVLEVKRGDRVAVLLGNRLDYAVVLFACAKLGALITLLNYAYSPAELEATIRMTTPAVLITTLRTSRFEYTSILQDLRTKIPQLKHVLVLEDTSMPNSIEPLPADFLNYNDLLAENSQKDPDSLPQDIQDEEVLNLQFTSGSTGLPKAAALTHHGMVNSASFITTVMKIRATDKIVVPVPLFHAFGLIIGLCAAIAAGAATILPSEYFDATETVRSIDRYKATGVYGVTTMFIDELALPNFSLFDRSSVRFALMAGSAMPENLLTEVINKFPVPEVFTNWGMTELSSIATMTCAADPIEKKLLSAGTLLPHFTGKIVEPGTGNTLPWGQRGEIVVSGFGVMHSYYNDPKRTDEAKRFHPEDVKAGFAGPDESGKPRQWMHTGDEGYLDKDGYLVVTGRIKDLIIRGGENISPLEIEARLFEHPAIKQASVFGIASRRYGEEVAAMLELGELAECRPSDDEIRNWVRIKLSRYKAPVRIWWLGDAELGIPAEWPKTANGKLRKPDIRKIGQALLESETPASLPAIRSAL